jgi:hypothetical protein
MAETAPMVPNNLVRDAMMLLLLSVPLVPALSATKTAGACDGGLDLPFRGVLKEIPFSQANCDVTFFGATQLLSARIKTLMMCRY